jgi:hypothetical protein
LSLRQLLLLPPPLLLLPPPPLLLPLLLLPPPPLLLLLPPPLLLPRLTGQPGLRVELVEGAAAEGRRLSGGCYHDGHDAAGGL